MKYIVAIDWKARYRKGFSFINLESKGKIEAMIEAPAVACKYGAKMRTTSTRYGTYNPRPGQPGHKN